MRPFRVVLSLFTAAMVAVFLLAEHAAAAAPQQLGDFDTPTPAGLNLPFDLPTVLDTKASPKEALTRYAKGKKWNKRRKKRRIKRKIRRAIRRAVVTGIIINEMSRASRGHYDGRGQCYRWRESCDRGYEESCRSYYRNCD